jgi:hypothetical protein
MTHSIALAGMRWYESRRFPSGKRFVAKSLVLNRREALGRKIMAAAREPLPVFAGRTPASEVNERARIWAIVESAHPELLWMVSENGRLSGELVKLKSERARLQAELEREVR